MKSFEIDATAKAFGDIPQEELSAAVASGIMALVKELGDYNQLRDRERVKREQNDLPLQVLRYAYAESFAPGVTVGGHCGDKVDMWYEAHSEHLSDICVLAAAEGLHDDAPFDAITLMKQAVNCLTAIEEDW